MFAPTHRCNSACRSCAWWRTPAGAAQDELTLAEIDVLAADLSRMGTRLVVFTGGEPLLRPDVFEAARLFRRCGIALHLLTSAIGLAARAGAVAEVFERVIISLDGSTPTRYREVRGVDGFGAVSSGVERLRSIAPRVPVSARRRFTQATSVTCPRSSKWRGPWAARASRFSRPT
jgi:MoaA/NifB/PqqE/SkfB family radical SAM enzyme